MTARRAACLDSLELLLVPLQEDSALPRQLLLQSGQPPAPLLLPRAHGRAARLPRPELEGLRCAPWLRLHDCALSGRRWRCALP